ncbi:MAG: hypothetical protein R3F30_08245 [Planctomycetota bacterium]
MTMRLATLCLVLLATLCGSCSGRAIRVVPVDSSYVSFTVEAYDAFGRPIEGVEVRLLEAWQERDGFVHPASGPLVSRFTDRRGLAVFDSWDLGQSTLGFWTDAYGDALLYDLAYEDRAVVTVLIGAPSLGWVRVDVPLSYLRPHNDVLLEY